MMKKLSAIAVLVVVGLVAPAQAEKPDRPSKPQAAEQTARPDKAPKGRCAARSVGFNASGTLLTATLTPGDAGRYSGTISVMVTRANHGAPKGEQTYTLTDARVKFREGVDAAAPVAGSRVKIGGKITKLNKKCPTDGFVPTVTVQRVHLKAAKTAGTEAAKDADDVKKADA